MVPKEPPVAALFDNDHRDVTIAFRDKQPTSSKKCRSRSSRSSRCPTASRRLRPEDGRGQAGRRARIDITAVAGDGPPSNSAARRCKATFNVKDVKTTRPRNSLRKSFSKSRSASARRKRSPNWFSGSRTPDWSTPQRRSALQQVLEKIAAAGRGNCRRTCSASRPQDARPQGHGDEERGHDDDQIQGLAACSNRTCSRTPPTR